jgi:hypothetical protein
MTGSIKNVCRNEMVSACFFISIHDVSSRIYELSASIRISQLIIQRINFSWRCALVFADAFIFCFSKITRLNKITG